MPKFVCWAVVTLMALKSNTNFGHWSSLSGFTIPTPPIPNQFRSFRLQTKVSCSSVVDIVLVSSVSLLLLMSSSSIMHIKHRNVGRNFQFDTHIKRQQLFVWNCWRSMSICSGVFINNFCQYTSNCDWINLAKCQHKLGPTLSTTSRTLHTQNTQRLHRILSGDCVDNFCVIFYSYLYIHWIEIVRLSSWKIQW